jgi:hypothetical protein
MHPTSLRRLLPAACAVVVGSALAQTAPRSAPAADPLDPAASVPALVHRSSLTTDYRRLRAEPAVPWREANDTVGRIGGWRAYLREASQPEPAAVPSPPARPASAAAPAPVPEPFTPRAAPVDHSKH